MVQIVSTMNEPLELAKSHQRKLVDGSDPFYSELDTPHKNILFCVHEPHTLQKPQVGLVGFKSFRTRESVVERI